jgi:hypothetical protein
MNTEFGLDEDAWKMWVEYRKQIRKPLTQASIPLAQKRLAALGPQQREAVEYSIGNGYQGLFAPKSAQKVVQKLNGHAIEMRELMARAEKVGFRAPKDGEDHVVYGMLVRRAEHEDYAKRQKTAGPKSIAAMLRQA